MLAKLRPRSVYDVLAAIGFFVAVSTGGAYAANTVFSSDIVDGEVKTRDLAGKAVTTNKLGAGAVTSPTVKDNNLTGADVLDNSLKGVDIDESTLSNIGGGGPAGGDLTGTYPNPQIRPDAVDAPEIATEAVGPAELADIFFVDTVESVPPNGGVAEVVATCSPGSQLISGGAWFDFASGDVSSSFPGGGTSWVVEGQNNGNFAQNLRARAWCMPPPGP